MGPCKDVPPYFRLNTLDESMIGVIIEKDNAPIIRGQCEVAEDTADSRDEMIMKSENGEDNSEAGQTTYLTPGKSSVNSNLYVFKAAGLRTARQPSPSVL